jgi:hypothetical protein
MTTGGLAVAATMSIALGAASCGSQKNTTAPLPTEPSPVTAVPTRVELIAPGSIAPGESVRLSARAVKSDNSADDVTGQAQWFSSNRSVLEVSPAGIATGIAPGEAIISTSYQSKGASAHTFVLPAGTFRVTGKVTEGNLGLPGATVTVVGGVGEGLSTVTNSLGTYTLFGVRDRVRLQAKLGGYFNRTEEVEISDHRTVDFELVAERQRTDVSGSYRLTIAGAGCSAPLSEARSYDATISQQGSQLTAVLTGADFIVERGRGNRFTGTIDGGDRITFTIGDGSFYYFYDGLFDLIERISAINAVIVDGIATATPSSTGISGTLAGYFLLTRGVAEPFTNLQARCYNFTHRFEMVRQ